MIEGTICFKKKNGKFVSLYNAANKEKKKQSIILYMQIFIEKLNKTNK